MQRNKDGVNQGGMGEEREETRNRGVRGGGGNLSRWHSWHPSLS